MAYLIIGESDVQYFLQKSDDQKIKKLTKDAGVMASLVKILNATFEIANEVSQKGKLSVGDAAFGFLKKNMEMSGMIEKVSESDTLKVTNTAINIALTNKELFKLVNATPGKAATGAMMVLIQKLLLLAGLQDRHKCELAIASMVTSTALTLPTAATPVGAIFTALTFIGGGIEAYGECANK